MRRRLHAVKPALDAGVLLDVSVDYEVGAGLEPLGALVGILPDLETFGVGEVIEPVSGGGIFAAAYPARPETARVFVGESDAEPHPLARFGEERRVNRVGNKHGHGC